MGAAKFAGFTTLDAQHLLTLRYGRVIDNSRMKARLGALGYTTREAVLDLYGVKDAWQAKQVQEQGEERVAAA